MSERLYLIDGYSNIFRAFYAIRNLSNSKGEPTNAVYGFLQMLRKLLRDEQPDLIGVALDVSRKTVRSEKFPDYKANRSPMPDELRSQVPWIRALLAAYKIPILELANYEADDVLGTLARKASDAGYEVVLVSADKDLMQLVTPRVRLFHTGRDKLYDPALVEQDFGLPPSKVADVLGLMGDASDNVPGVPGIGEKGAKTLIAQYGSVEALLDNAEQVQRKSYRESLLENRQLAELSKDLVTIHTDLDLAFDPTDLRHDPPDDAALRELFTELEFFSLLDELEATGGGEVELPELEEVTEPHAWEQVVAGLGQRAVVAAIGEEPVIGLALGQPVGAEATPEQAGDLERGWFADLRNQELAAAVARSLAAWTAEPEHELVGHDLKEVLRLGGRPDGDPPPCRARLSDLMLVSYLLRSAHAHGLDELSLERLGRKPIAAKEAGWSRGQEPPPGDARLLAYASERVGLAAALAPGLLAELERGVPAPDGEAAADEAAAEPLGDGWTLARVYREIEEPLLPVLLAMEEAGVLLDVDYLAAMSVELGAELDALEGTIYELAGERFNIQSSQQLGVILFEKLDYPVLKRTRKTKSYSTGADVLEELAARGYPLPAEILRFRELAKLKSTYVDALPALVAADGRIHTRFNQAVAATGRLSSTNPNLQNIPVRTEQGQRIRRAFVAPPGHLLLVADYSQIELRVLAHIAGEEKLLTAFRSGEDIHRATASTVFGVAPELVTGEQRRAAKTINFGILYGISGFGLANNLGVTPKEADRFIKDYLDRYPSIQRYLVETKESAAREGKVETLYGRVRWLPEIHSRNYNVRENANRMAINARIQGTAADLMKLAMIAVDVRLRADHPTSRLLLTVHDELVLEVPAGEVEAVAATVRAQMEGVAELAVPLAVDVAWGESWYAAKER
jgi:DNA polymerase-1